MSHNLDSTIAEHNFETDMENFRKMVKDKKTQLELDNEYSRLTELYALDQVLTQKGYKNLKKITEKFWSGMRLDDQELAIAYILCPKIILYEKVKYRMLDLVNQIEEECKKRWGYLSPPRKSMMVINNMCEKNPDYVDGSNTIILAIWQNMTINETLNNEAMTNAVVEYEQDQNR